MGERLGSAHSEPLRLLRLSYVERAAEARAAAPSRQSRGEEDWMFLDAAQVRASFQIPDELGAADEYPPAEAAVVVGPPFFGCWLRGAAARAASQLGEFQAGTTMWPSRQQQPKAKHEAGSAGQPFPLFLLDRSSDPSFATEQCTELSEEYPPPPSVTTTLTLGIGRVGGKD